MDDPDSGSSGVCWMKSEALFMFAMARSKRACSRLGITHVFRFRSIIMPCKFPMDSAKAHMCLSRGFIGVYLRSQIKRQQPKGGRSLGPMTV